LGNWFPSGLAHLISKSFDTQAGIGGPLVYAKGNYIGMNFYDPKVGDPALFCDDIVDVLDRFKNGD